MATSVLSAYLTQRQRSAMHSVSTVGHLATRPQTNDLPAWVKRYSSCRGAGAMGSGGTLPLQSLCPRTHSSMKLSQISEALDLHLENGFPDTEITGVKGIEEASAGDITFVANPKYGSAAKTTRASAIIVSDDFPSVPLAMLRSKNPYLAFARAIELFYQPPKYAPGIHPTAVVSPTAKVAKRAHLGPYVVVGDNVTIGEDSVLLAHVVIYAGATIGKNFF